MPDHGIVLNIDGVYFRKSACGRVSAIDFVAWATGNKAQASQTVINIGKRIDDTGGLAFLWIKELPKRVFTGSLQKTSSLDKSQALKMMTILPSVKASLLREVALDMINRLFADDETPYTVVDANANSDEFALSTMIFPSGKFFDVIVLNIDGVDFRKSACGRVSAIDFVAWATGNKKQASQTVINIGKRIDDTGGLAFPWVGELPQCVFTGSLQKTSSLDKSQALKMMTILSSVKASLLREVALDMINRLFADDETPHTVVDANANSDEFAVSTMIFPSGKFFGETKAHKDGKEWMALNSDTIKIQWAFCPVCYKPAPAACIAGSSVRVEGPIAGSGYVADVLIFLDDETHIAIEVCHTSPVAPEKKSYYKEQGILMYEVHTSEIRRAIAWGGQSSLQHFP
jgi:hypothetical protein